MLGLDAIDSLALSLHHSPGTCAVLVGSGLSRAAGIPSGWEITLDLIRRLAATKGVSNISDWAEWYRDEFGSDPNYSAILDALASTPHERRALLHRYIEGAEGEAARKPTKAHHALAKLVLNGAVKVILTTNFDRLIENSLREIGIEPTVITNEHSLAGATPMTHAACTVVKMHGDYLDTRIKNTDSELNTYDPQIDRLLDRVFDEYGLFIVGWSGEWDTALRMALLRANTRRYPFYWATRGDLRPLAQDIVAHRHGQVIKISDADAFLCQLNEKVDAIRAADRAHPVTVAASLALVKKYCRSDEYDAEWAEFLEFEASKLRALISGSEWPTERPEENSIGRLVETVLARTEVLRRAFMLAAKWGTRKAQRQLVRTLVALMPSEPIGGYTVWSDLRKLPAALCFYWGVAGAIDGENLQLAADFLTHKLPLRNRETAPAVSMLPLLELQAEIWRMLLKIEDRDGRSASLWLRNTLGPELADIATPPQERERIIDEAEFLMGLESSFHRKMRAERESGLWAWFPLGLYTYRDGSDGFKARLTEMENLPSDHRWLKVGLLGGTSAGGKLAASNMRETLHLPSP